jgi:hypothetical protein
LWENFTAYTSVIERAEVLLNAPGKLNAARLEQACELLLGTSVRLARPMPPLGKRELTSGGQVQLTLAGTVTQMRRSFTMVAGVLTAAEHVWNLISDQLRPIADGLDEITRQAAGWSDAGLSTALSLASTTLRELREALSGDPLSLYVPAPGHSGQVDTTRLDQLRQQAAAARTRAAEMTRLGADASQRIDSVSATVTAARQAWQDAMAARERAAALVLVKKFEVLPDVSGLAGKRAELTELRQAGRWTRLASELDLLAGQATTALAQCGEAERAAAGLVGQRDELRGLLGAYRAKASRIGAIEELDGRYRQARDLLWSAPCDLDRARAAVTGYQQAILDRGRT